MGAAASIDEEDATNARFQPSAHPSNPRTRRHSFQEVQMQSPTPTSTNYDKPAHVPTSNRKGTSAPAVGNSANVATHNQKAQTHQPKQTPAETSQENEILLETFCHKNGEEYSCIQMSGTRFYMNKNAESDWLPFPSDWIGEGVFITYDKIIYGEDSSITQDDITQIVYGKVGLEHLKNQSANEPQQVAATATTSSAAATYVTDDRSGSLQHPISNETLQTYMFAEKRNFHCYFDEGAACWIPIPLTWELQSDMVKQFISQIQDVVPHWKDREEILVTLRANSYDINSCIDAYNTTQQQGSTSRSELLIQQRNEIISLKKKLKEQEDLLKKEKKKFSELESHLLKANKVRPKDQSDKDQSTISKLQQQIAVLEKILQTETDAKNKQEVSTLESSSHLVNSVAFTRLCSNVSSLQQSYKGLRKEVNGNLQNLNDLFKTAVQKVSQLRVISQSMETVSQSELEESRSLYRRECAVRKALYNQLQELRGNIRVFARCRRDDSCTTAAITFPNDEDMFVVDQKGHKRRFTFDRVYSPQCSQQEVFEDTKAIVTSCVDGYNICVLAYGQTGSGKTHTMMGPPADPGVNIRVIQELLTITEARDNIDYKLTISMVEIYNEVVQDLLSEDCKTIQVQQVGTAVNLVGLTTQTVRTKDDITNLMNVGMTNRTVASTKMNSQSSRSHLLVMLTVEGADRSSKARSRGMLTLVDLAGSERVAKTEASCQRLVEAAAINKSLSSLGQVFSALGKSALHVPFRNSKLTQVLQPSLSGDAKAVLLVAVSPAESNLSETLSTLTFGANAKQIELGQAKSNVTR